MNLPNNIFSGNWTEGHVQGIAVDVQNKAEAHRKEVQKAEAIANAKKLSELSVTVLGKGGNGKMFGSISSLDVAEAIKAQRGIEIDKYGKWLYNIKK